LLRKTRVLLESAGFKVYTHRQVPCNDGGISLGQAVIANFSEV
jgi:hydrogenase maturation protein HypF